MNDKALVLDEPIATGWARKQFSGDEEKAKGYMTAARSLLGAMKTIHGVNERIAIGEPGGYFSMRRVLPDGTLIEVSTNDGHDMMQITAASVVGSISKSETGSEQQSRIAESPLQHEEFDIQSERKRASASEKVEYPEVLICGTCDDGTNLHPTVWGFKKYPLDLGALKDCTTGEALAISADGETVVGYSRGSGVTKAFRWDQKNGMRALGPVSDGNYAIATDVSENGTVICGICGNDDGTYSIWRWTEVLGFKIFPDLGYGVSNIGIPTVSIRVNDLRYDACPSISPNGRYITGVMLRRDPHPVYVGAIWDGDIMSQIPLPGTTSDPYGVSDSGAPHPMQQGLSGPLQNGDQSYPVSVTDDGLVVGYSTHLDMVYFTYHIDQSDGISPPDQIGRTFDPLSPQTAFMWNIGMGACTYVNDGDAAAIANDSPTIAGNSESGVLVTRVIVEKFEHADGRPDTITTTTDKEFANKTPYGWYLDGANPVVSLGDWTSSYDVSDDGEVIVGSAQNDSNSMPAMWDLGRDLAKLTLLPLIPGATRGWATSVATSSSEVDLGGYEYDV